MAGHAQRNRDVVTPQPVWRSNPDQLRLREAYSGSATYILGYGGTGSGKTLEFLRMMILRALNAPSSQHLCLRRFHTDARKKLAMVSYMEIMRMAYPGIKDGLNKSDWYAKLPGDSTIWFAGCDEQSERMDSILGARYATILCDEISQINYDIFVQVRRGLQQQVMCKNPDRPDDPEKPLRLKMYLACNPPAKSHWSYREFFKGERPDRPAGVKIVGWEKTHAAVKVRTQENLNNLAAGVKDILENLPDRQRQRFWDGDYQEDATGALWQQAWIDKARVDEQHLPAMVRVVVGVDPSAKSGKQNDDTGIVVVGKDDRKPPHFYVLEDATCHMSPAGWGAKAVEMYVKHRADMICGEVNNGGDMVENTIRTVDGGRDVPFTSVHATRGKILRAEPISALYEPSFKNPAGRVHHVGDSDRFRFLEDQMTSYTGEQGSASPDRL